jgi:plastocyanin
MRSSGITLIGILMLLPGGPLAAPAGGTVRGTVSVKLPGGKQVSDPRDVWVYLELLDRKPPPQPGKGVEKTIVQKLPQFSPRVQVVQVAAKVRFPNADYKEEHNVFGHSETDRDGFDLGRYWRGPGRAQEFDKPGEYDIYCDIHKDMTAKVKVIDSPYMIEVKRGAYSLPDIPPGKYKVVAWMPDSAEVKSEVITVVAGRASNVFELKLQKGSPKTHHLRKDNSPYPGTVYRK